MAGELTFLDDAGLGSPISVSSANPLPTTATGGGGGAATIADGADVAEGSVVDPAWTGTGNSTVIASLKAIATAAISTAAAPVKGATAAAASLTQPPVTIGGRAATTNPTAVTDGQVVNTMHDKLGKLVAVGAVRILKGVQVTTITSSTGETTIVTAVASTFLDLYGLIIANSSSTICLVTIKDATAGTTRAVVEVPANDTRGFMLPVDSAIPQAVVNNNWTATCGTSVNAITITALTVQNL